MPILQNDKNPHFFTPFGPTMGYFKMPSEMVEFLNKNMDKGLKDNSENLVGKVTQELRFDTDIKNYAVNFVRTGNIKNPRRHLGIYGYSFKTLSALIKLKPTNNELSLNLEQLRFLENNYSIFVSHFEKEIPNGIDTQDDVYNALMYLKE